MKRILMIAALTLLAPGAYAQMKGMEMKDMPMKMDGGKTGETHKGKGTVTKVDKNKVTIRHEPVQSLNWPSMTMAFTVKNKVMLDKLAKDKKVEFEFKQEGKDYVITDVK